MPFSFLLFILFSHSLLIPVSHRKPNFWNYCPWEYNPDHPDLYLKVPTTLYEFYFIRSKTSTPQSFVRKLCLSQKWIFKQQQENPEWTVEDYEFLFNRYQLYNFKDYKWIKEAIRLELKGFKDGFFVLYRFTSLYQMNSILDARVDSDLIFKPLQKLRNALLLDFPIRASLGDSPLPKDISFGYSLLSGYYNDHGACPYQIGSNSENGLMYALLLPIHHQPIIGKTFMFPILPFFSLPKLNVEEQVLEKGEYFHPRFELFPFYQEPETYFEKHIRKEVPKMFEMLKDFAKWTQNQVYIFHYQKHEVNIEEIKRNHLLLDQLLNFNN